MYIVHLKLCLFVYLDSCAVKACDLLCLVCATSRSAPFATWFSTHWLAPLHKVSVRLIRAPCEDALVASALLQCEYYWGSEMRTYGDRQTGRQAERLCQRSGRHSNWPALHREGRSNHVGFMVYRVWLWWGFFALHHLFPCRYHCAIFPPSLQYNLDS